jgi:serine protease Do
VYIEVMERKEVAEPLPSFTTDPLFRQNFEVYELKRKFEGELKGMGSGMIIDSQGHILTNNHVVSGATKIRVRLASGTIYPANLVGADPKMDLAVIQISANESLPHVTFGDSDLVEMGEDVVAIGHGRSITKTLAKSVTQTIVHGIVRANDACGIMYCSGCPDYLSTDVGDNPGNRGGLLLNLQGEVIGVEVAIVSKLNASETLGFAIPSNTAVHIAGQLISYGHVERG